MKIINTKVIADKLEEVIDYISCNIEDSCAKALQYARSIESNPTCAFALDVMNDNIDIAKQQHTPVCQDTGMVVVFASIGNEVILSGDLLEDALNNAVINAYKALRKSVLDPISRVNTGNNAPCVLHINYVKGDTVKIEVMLKGFGSENMSKAYMLNPAEGLEEAKRLIVETVKLAGSNPCPPVIVGVGLGGTFEKACIMSKHSLFRQIGSQNSDPILNQLEIQLLNDINQLGIGAQGFGGKTTALGVFIESYPTHISSLPVAVNILCHCSRSASYVIEGENV